MKCLTLTTLDLTTSFAQGLTDDEHDRGSDPAQDDDVVHSHHHQPGVVDLPDLL